MPLDTIKITKINKPIVLMILDGWGLSPTWGGNAIAMNNPPNINSYWRHYHHTVLQAFQTISRETYTLANSEIGHASLGSGRMIKPDFEDINEAIENKSFFQNSVLKEAIAKVKEKGASLHLLGLLSDGGVHSHINHLYALLEMAKKEKCPKVYIHVITDGRDTGSTSAIKYLTDLNEKCKKIGLGEIATISGRYYAMDRNKNWKLIESAYRAQVYGKGRAEKDPLQAISNLYRDGYTDEFIIPTVISKNNKPVGLIKNGDSVIFFNFRADRAQELTRAYVDPALYKSLFMRKYRLLNIDFMSLTDYKLNIPGINISFPSGKIDTTLAKILSNHSLKQLHIAESEKKAHVTYFFNGGYEKPFAGEDDIIVESPKVSSYDQKPEMAAREITEKTLSAINSGKYDFILINFANVDMIGHTGNIIAASKAVEIVDKSVGKIVEKTLSQGGIAMITADHGNIEQMVSLHKLEKDPETIHSLNPVPFIAIGSEFKKNLFKSAIKSNELLLSEIISTKHTLADVAPTVLKLYNIAKPSDMTGRSLLGELE